MLKLQDTKLGLAEAALGEGSGTRLQKLSVKQIKDVRPASLLLPSLLVSRPCLTCLISALRYDPDEQQA